MAKDKYGYVQMSGYIEDSRKSDKRKSDMLRKQQRAVKEAQRRISYAELIEMEQKDIVCAS